MHALITGFRLTDHADRNGLNNCRCNLRDATVTQNNANMISRRGTSRYKGVSWHVKARKWTAKIKCAGEAHYLGLFAEEADAARAYNDAALQIYGSFARLNDVAN